MYMAIGQCGSVLGSHLYPATEGPHYMFVFTSCLVCAASPLTLSRRFTEKALR